MLGFFVLALLVGGSSADAISAAAARLASIPILVLALWRLAETPPRRAALVPFLILAGAVALPLLQLIPLPPVLWSRLPGRREVALTYAAAGMALPWLPLSLTPALTWNAFLGLAPPTAMFCAVVTLDGTARERLAQALLLIVVLSVGLAALQVVGGEAGPWGLYGNATGEIGSGFFANQNHQATLLLISIPFAAFVAARSVEGPRKAFWIVVMSLYAVTIMVGVAATRSRAGVALAAPAAVGALAIAARGSALEGRSSWTRWVPAVTLFLAIVCAGVLVARFSLTPLADKFQTEASDLRFQFYPTVVAAARAYAPWGGGMGSFDTIYRTLERPETLMSLYVNHAHNDYLETWLEAGWAGVALMVAFLCWWLASLVAILRGPRTADTGLALAGAVAVGLLLAHSVVDYPLRTPALATVLGLACGLMTRPAQRPRGSPGGAARLERRARDRAGAERRLATRA